jgi:hypothetical protein
MYIALSNDNSIRGDLCTSGALPHLHFNTSKHERPGTFSVIFAQWHTDVVLYLLASSFLFGVEN